VHVEKRAFCWLLLLEGVLVHAPEVRSVARHQERLVEMSPKLSCKIKAKIITFLLLNKHIL